MTALGLPATPVPAAPNRAPVWPTGLIGTITHTRGYCAAAVARRTDLRAVGHGRRAAPGTRTGVRRMILRPEEADRLARLPAGVSWPVVVFSAKETVYKVWHPVVGSWLDFLDATVELDPDTGVFTARIDPARVAAATVADPPSVVTGRFVIEDDLVRTAAVLPLR